MKNPDNSAARLNFQHVLRRYRLAAGLTQEQLSEKMDVSLGFLCTMEVGRKWPNLDMLFIIAKALDVRPSELIAALEDELGFKVTKG